jgi:excisionase family DNA binding protein
VDLTDAPLVNPSPEYLTLQAAAASTSYSYSYVYRAARRGDLPATQKGRTWRVAATDLRRWMDRDRGGAVPLPRPELDAKVRLLMPGLCR